jgi:hypothetical protein
MHEIVSDYSYENQLFRGGLIALGADGSETLGQ